METQTFAEPTGNTDGIDADVILSQVESGQDPNPVQPKAPEQPTPQQIEEFDLNWNGKQFKAPKDKVLTWAQQGFDYSQKLSEFNRQKEEFEKSYSPYKTIDSYAKENPEWWQHVTQSWESRAQQAAQAAQESNAQGVQIPEALKQEIESLKQFKNQIESEKQAQLREKEDTALAGEIQSIRKQFKEIDWDTANGDGLTLEQQVLKHAMDHGIGSYKAAFLDYKHDHLLKLAEERGKESVNKELQRRTKLGLLGESSTPTKGITQAKAVKSKTYGDLAAEALEELRSGAN